MRSVPVGTALIMQFDIDATNQVAGTIIDLDDEGDGVPVSLTASLNGTAFTAQSSAGQYSVNGTFDTALTAAVRRLTGTLRDNVRGRDVT